MPECADIASALVVWRSKSSARRRVRIRWAADPTGWTMLHRRLARDREPLPASSEAMIHIASIDNIAKRMTDETTPAWRGTRWVIKGNSPRSNAS